MLDTFTLSSFGAFHTLLALIAVVAGLLGLVRHGEIGTGTRAGLTYVVFTVLTSVTGLFIFRHGSFGPPHVLAIATLVVLAIAYAAEKRGNPHGFARYVAVLGYSLTLFFHLIPGLTETGTRLPLGDPAFTGPEDPTLKALVGAGFLVYLVGAAVQVLRIRRWRRLVPST
ncbi:DUF2306 domain-containing protein [Lysobacter solisilvae (ex Woo and Kim 2020)]|uniref:DUF2306 domain-containing protein n=1 Tax=Agrilutibacter terrestris TaxID=2865112 RepID=A0A7H0FU13_9GAMM|nr:hypothetical protein [Lysobacter terrestris]QNP39529.1 hypothetical protein H8B22_08275 [Lysobacter terrestris]